MLTISRSSQALYLEGGTLRNWRKTRWSRQAKIFAYLGSFTVEAQRPVATKSHFCIPMEGSGLESDPEQGRATLMSPDVGIQRAVQERDTEDASYSRSWSPWRRWYHTNDIEIYNGPAPMPWAKVCVYNEGQFPCEQNWMLLTNTSAHQFQGTSWTGPVMTSEVLDRSFNFPPRMDGCNVSLFHHQTLKSMGLIKLLQDFIK